MYRHKFIYKTWSPCTYPLYFIVHWYDSSVQTLTKRQATQQDRLPSLLADRDKWIEIVFGEVKKYFALGRLKQPRQYKISCTSKTNQPRTPFICTFWVPQQHHMECNIDTEHYNITTGWKYRQNTQYSLYWWRHSTAVYSSYKENDELTQYLTLAVCQLLFLCSPE
jgi:hypothetical protein